MAGPKRHHYVPNSYLGRFAPSGVLQVRRRDGSAFTTSTDNIAVENGFYDVTLPNGTVSKDVEEWLGKVESPALAAMRRIDETQTPPGPQDEDRAALSMYLAVQLNRTPQQRERVLFPERVASFLGGRQLTKDLMAEYLRETHLGFDPGPGEVQGAFDFVNWMFPGDGMATVEDSMRILFETTPTVAAHLAALHWSVEHDRKARLVTSDSPLVLWRKPSAKDAYYGLGIDGCDEIRFPLDPTKQLVLSPRPRPAHVRVTPQRSARCNQDLAYGCHHLVCGSPTQEQRLAQLELPSRGPVLRFNSGPLYQPGEDGDVAYQGDVVHTWVPRR